MDIILPYDSDGRGSLKTYSGIDLAEHAAAQGVEIIAFLTVVRLAEVEDRFRDLQTSYPTVNFSYFDKTDLLRGHQLKTLVDSLVDFNSPHP